MSTMPAVVLWDFDGTLVDSETMWDHVERGLARELGGELAPDYHKHTLGGTIANTAGYIKGVTGSEADTAWIEAELWARAMADLAEGPIRWMPGVETLLRELADAGVTQGLVSSGHRRYLDVTLRRLDPSPFAVEVAGDEVAHNKPHPEPYLRALSLLGCSPEDCVVIEDSQTGVDAGLAAGCAVVAVPTGGHVRSDDNYVVHPSLAGVDGAVFAELAAGAKARRVTP